MTAAASPSVTNLAATWRSLDALCSDLTEEQWKAPTGCPGWSVQDNLAHLVDYEAGALGRPRPDHRPADLGHTKNELGALNEAGVDLRRSQTGQQVLQEFREVTAARHERLLGLTEEDLARPVDTPAGPGTLADMLRLRVMDSWSHEQDIRRALGRPGHVDGPAAQEAVDYFAQLLPYVVAKRAGAPDGATVVFRIGDLRRVVVEMVGGRGRLAEQEPDDPTASLRMPVPTFAALVGGRSDAPDDVELGGDGELGSAIVANLGVMP